MRPLWRWVIRCAGGLLAAAAPPAAHPQPPMVVHTFERWQPAAPQASAQRALLGLVRQRAAVYGVHLRADGRLAQAAHGLLPWARAHAGDTLPMALLQTHAWQQGVTDGELSAVAIRSQATQWRAVVAQQMDALLAGNSDVDYVGLAIDEAGEGDEVTAVVMLSRRLLRLAPLPSHVALQATLHLSGSRLDPRIDAMWLAAERPGGAIERHAVPLCDGHFSAPLPVGRAAGTVRVQLLVERGNGPEVAVNVPISVGRIHPGGPQAPTAPPAHQSLLTLIYGLRQAHQLPLPAPSPMLTRLAQMHADDMAAHHFFAHVSPTMGDAARRLEADGQHYERVVENLASAPDADAAFAQWQRSPAHLANLLDGRIDHIGLGVAAPATRSDDTLIVLLMARL